jgi:hypothetical protein
VADPPGVSVAFDDDWAVPDPAWTRLDTLAGCRVRGYTIDRGRPTEFDKTGTGTAVIRIVDRQGIFDPTNPANATKVTPGKQANISLLNPVNGTWHTLFRGYVESWRYVLDQTRQYMELELQLTDGFAILSRRELRVGVDGVLPLPTEVAEGNVGYGETAGTVGDRVLAILADAEWPAALATDWISVAPGTIPDIFSGNVRVGPKVYAGASALDALWDAADAEFPGVANLFMASDGHIRFRGRQARFRPDVAQYGITPWTVGDPSAWATDTSVVPVAELEWSNGEDNLYNSCTATPQGVGSGTAWRPLNPDPPHNDNVAGQLVQDAASIAAYGLRGLTFDNLQTIEGKATSNDSMVETRLFASYYVENYATPHPRISRIVFKTRAPTAIAQNASKSWEFLCNAEISDLLTVKTDHPGAGGFNADFYVEGLHYVVTPGPPEHAIVELSLDVSPRAHWTSNPFDTDPDPA